MRVLLTGFEAWGNQKRNSSGEAVRLLLQRPPRGVDLRGEVLPTEFRESGRRIAAAIDRERPDALVMTGLAPTRKKIGLEAIALNVDHTEEADVAGERPWRRAIARGGWVLESTLPIDALHRRLKAAKIPVSISYHAGTYVCNHVFFVARHHAPRLAAGFVHVPPRPMKMIVRALSLIVASL